MRVQVAWSPRAGEAVEQGVELAPGATLADALAAAAVNLDDGAPAGFGVWGRERPLDHVLADGDRVEVYRPLRLDPKEARRRRAAPRRKGRAARRFSARGWPARLSARSRSARSA